MIILLFLVTCLLLFLLLSWELALWMLLPTTIVYGVLGLLLRRRVSAALRLPPQTGVKLMIGSTAEVVSVSRRPGRTDYLVRHEGELWSATSKEELSPGDQVRIIAVDGVRLTVARAEKPEQDQAKSTS